MLDIRYYRLSMFFKPAVKNREMQPNVSFSNPSFNSFWVFVRYDYFFYHIPFPLVFHFIFDFSHYPNVQAGINMPLFLWTAFIMRLCLKEGLKASFLSQMTACGLMPTNVVWCLWEFQCFIPSTKYNHSSEPLT